MAAASDDWALAEDHLSRALRLVELTYPAIAAALGAAEGVRLSESWAQQRSVHVRGLLLELGGPGAALSSDDLARVLQQRSIARRAVRLQAFGMTEVALAPYLDRIQVPDVPTGEVVVLLGDFGSGKSESLETWHRAMIAILSEGHCEPLPVWLSARDLAGQPLEAAVDAQLGTIWRQGRGAAIAVDGLDETDPATAQNLLESARTVVRTHDNVRVLLTARPGILSPTKAEESAASLLSEDDALKLVELAGGRAHATWRWTEDMRITVRRPFFALAAGAMLARDERPAGEADLIRGLVESSLAKGTERSALTSEASRTVLEKLAIGLTRGDGDCLSFGDRQTARSSRLVADGPSGSVLFSLPVFQHWFAAQSLLAGTVSSSEVVANGSNFSRWRWAAAVAALSAPLTSLDDLVATWITANPGAGSWILDEAFGGHRGWRAEEGEDLDPNTSGDRLLRAMRTWADALGPMSHGVLPQQLVRGPVELGVTVAGPRIDVALSMSRPVADLVIPVPAGMHPFLPNAVPGWTWWSSGGAPVGDAWPWIMVQKRIADSTINMLSCDPYLGAPGGVWVQERHYDLGRRLLSRGSLFYGELPSEEVKSRATESFNVMGRDRTSSLSFGGSASYSGAELDDLVTRIDSLGTGTLSSHLPECDVPNSKGGYVWDRYSNQTLMEFEVEVYGRACDAYDEALANTFRSLGWSIPGSVLAPFGVILEMRLTVGDGLGDMPGMTVMRVPMELMVAIASSDGTAVWSMNGRSVITRVGDDQFDDWERHYATIGRIQSWLARRNRELMGGIGWSSTGADDMARVRPASTVAAQWLCDDLKGLGLATGTVPRLR